MIQAIDHLVNHQHHGWEMALRSPRYGDSITFISGPKMDILEGFIPTVDLFISEV